MNRSITSYAIHLSKDGSNLGENRINLLINKMSFQGSRHKRLICVGPKFSAELAS